MQFRKRTNFLNVSTFRVSMNQPVAVGAGVGGPLGKRQGTPVCFWHRLAEMAGVGVSGDRTRERSCLDATPSRDGPVGPHGRLPWCLDAPRGQAAAPLEWGAPQALDFLLGEHAPLPLHEILFCMPHLRPPDHPLCWLLHTRPWKLCAWVFLRPNHLCSSPEDTMSTSLTPLLVLWPCSSLCTPLLKMRCSGRQLCVMSCDQWRGVAESCSSHTSWRY